MVGGALAPPCPFLRPPLDAPIVVRMTMVVCAMVKDI